MARETIRVLLADADRDRTAYLSSLLERAGSFQVARVSELEPAVEALRESPFDVILADLALQDSEGLPTLAILLTYAADAPVVVLCDSADDPVPLRALQQGACDHLPRDQLYETPVVRSILYAVERRRAARALQASEQRYRTLFQQSRDAVYVTDAEDRLLEVNRAALELFEYRAEALVGRPLSLLFADPADHAALTEQLRRTGSVRELEVRLRSGEGREVWCLLAATRPEGGTGGSQGIIHDITARKETELRLAFDALHDRLTGLANRVLLMDRLKHAWQVWARQPQPTFAVLFLDLDRFKGVNDTLGHDAGDMILRRTAGLLRSCVRASDTVARLGGDEFVVLLEGIEGPGEAVQIAERMQRLLDRPYTLAGRDFFTTASIGIGTPSERTTEAEDVIQHADRAMYRAKARGGGRYVVFDPAMHRAAVSRLELESDLRQGIHRGEFVLLYQPIISLDSGRTTGFEALMRWRQPDRGTLLPDDFIPLAEETGLIVPLGLWALREAASQLRRWREEGAVPGGVVMSVNVSARHFQEPDLLAQVERIVREERVRPRQLMLELTETSLMQDPEQAAAKLIRLRELGIRICLDDFGTGYSSLGHLRRFPLDTLKVDRSFIGRLDRSPRDLALVNTITTLARKLGISAIVEGVETRDQLARVRRLGPREAQGFLFARPMEPGSAAAFGRAPVPHLGRTAGLRSWLTGLRTSAVRRRDG